MPKIPAKTCVAGPPLVYLWWSLHWWLLMCPCLTWRHGRNCHWVCSSYMVIFWVSIIQLYYSTYVVYVSNSMIDFVAVAGVKMGT